jgi:hypothetical protein
MEIRPMINITLPADSATEKASKSDSEWFARNPHRTYRVRRCLRDEFPWKHFDGFTRWTVVKQIKPGVRLRLSLFVKNGLQPNDADCTIRPLFDCLLDCTKSGITGLQEPGTPLGEAVGNAFSPPTHVLSENAQGGIQ